MNAIGSAEKIVIIPEGVCCDRVFVDVADGVIQKVEFDGGCPGNGNAIARLLAGQTVAHVVTVLSGVDCDGKGTSCADQLARGLKERLG